MSIKFDNIKEAIIEEIDQANNEIKLMLAWFTDRDIFSALERKVRDGLTVKLLLSNSDWNVILYKKFEELNCHFKNFIIKTYGSSQPDISPFLHTKVCIIDKRMVLSGSYNWTRNAAKNKESLSLTLEEESVRVSLSEFNLLWNNSTDIDFTDNNIEEKLQKMLMEEAEGADPETTKGEIDAQLSVANLNIVDSQKIKETHEVNLFNFLPKDERLTYDNTLRLWGIEKYNNEYLYLKFMLDNQFLHCKIHSSTFTDVLKRNKKLFLLWNVMGRRYSLYFLNLYAEMITFVPPIVFEYMKKDVTPTIVSYREGNCILNFRLEKQFETVIEKFIRGETTIDDFIKLYPATDWI